MKKYKISFMHGTVVFAALTIEAMDTDAAEQFIYLFYPDCAYMLEEVSDAT